MTQHQESRTIPWNDKWRTNSPEEIAKLFQELEAIAKLFQDVNAIEGDDPPTGIFLAVNATLKGSTFITYRRGYLLISALDSHGRPTYIYDVTSNEIKLSTARGGRYYRKTWQLYFSFREGMVWKCVYNENPTSPKHLLSECIPTTGDQLQAELVNMLHASRKARSVYIEPHLRDALENAICGVEWLETFDQAVMDTLKSNYAVIQQVFNRPLLPEPCTHDALTALQAAVLPGYDIVQMYNSFVSMMEDTARANHQQ